MDNSYEEINRKTSSSGGYLPTNLRIDYKNGDEITIKVKKYYIK